MFPLRDHNPSGRTPVVTIALIVVNLAVFLLTFATLGEWQLARVFMQWGLVPARIGAGEGAETLITHMFLHGGWMHVLGNMLFLWIFGDNLEDRMGHLGFSAFYLACGLAAAGLQYAADPASGVPMVGASGAIAGVMGGYLLFFPRARVDVLVIFIIFFRVFALRAWTILGLWFALQLFGGFAAPGQGGGVAYWAHAGGFLAGLALAAPVWLRQGGAAFWARTSGQPPHPEATGPFRKTTIPRVRSR